MIRRTLLLIAKISITSALSCSKSYECAGVDFNTSTDGNFGDANGYKSNYGPTSSYAGGSCNAAFSCNDISLIQTRDATFYCSGTHSCSNTSIQILGDTESRDLNCDGAMSCSYSNIVPHSSNNAIPTGVFGGGDKSLAYSSIEGINTIEGNGAYSLYKANIDSNNINITMSLRGYYAGYGAKLLCRDNDKCTIRCEANACDHFYIQCLGECIINKQSHITISPINATTDAQFNEADTLSIESYIYDSETAIINDNHCNDYSNNYSTDFIFDNSDENANGPDIIYNNNRSGPLCCRAYSSCKYTNISIDSSDIIISGKYAAVGSNILSNNSTIFAQAREALIGVSIFNAAYVYSAGFASTPEARVIGARNIVCSGTISCRDSTIITSGANLNITLSGYGSGDGLHIYCNSTDVCNIQCLGSGSCDRITLMCDGICNVECDAGTECPYVYTSSPTQATIAPSIKPTDAPLHVSTKRPTSALSTMTDTLQNILTSTESDSVQSDNVATTSGTVYKATTEPTTFSLSATVIPTEDDQLVIPVIISCLCFVIIMLLVVLGFKKSKMKKSIENQNQLNLHQSQQEMENETPTADNNGDLMDGEGPITNGIGQIVNAKDDLVMQRRYTIDLLMVKSWFETELQLPIYYDIFINNGYERLDIIKEINDDEELKAIGIVSKAHRDRILKMIKQLNNNENRKREGSELNNINDASGESNTTKGKELQFDIVNGKERDENRKPEGSDYNDGCLEVNDTSGDTTYGR